MAENTIQWDKDADGIVTLTLDDPTGTANVMNEHYRGSMAGAVERLVAEKDSITGVVVTSAKKMFFAGGDLKHLITVGPEDADYVFHTIEEIKRNLRTLETLGKPVVAAINGAALGGGLEIALACHHRIAVDIAGLAVGFPEVPIGLMPGGGGVTRTVRMLGIQNAFMTVLSQGTRFKPAKAKEIGLVDEVVATVEELVPAAKAWIKANPDAFEQPWDKKGYKMPGGTPSSPALAAVLPSFPALLRKQLKGANMPAPKAILAATIEGAQVDFDTASRIESRYFTQLVTGQIAKNMIQAFFDMQFISSGGSRPEGIGKTPITKIGVLGAGMMGAGIAYVSAKAGFDVVLKDVNIEAAEKGKNYSEKIETKALERGKTTQEKSDALLARITPSTDPADFKGVDFVVEAVFESQDLKHQVFGEIEDIVEPNALLGSNTSTLPITGLATGVKRQGDFIGIHFFSPVDEMPLVEIIKGEKTSDEALARVFDYTLAIGKTPIVVNDSRGFFTSRVIGTFINEALAMLGEGVEPASIEHAGGQAGYPAPPLQLSDELNLELMHKIAAATRKGVEDSGGTYEPHPAEAVVEKMIEIARPSRLKGAGFYEYLEGKRTRLWPGLRDTFKSGASTPPLQDMIDRMLFAEALETQKCIDEGVLTTTADANIGSILGIGFPPWTGGSAQFIVGYEGPAGIGKDAFVARAKELAAKYGDRFRPPASLKFANNVDDAFAVRGYGERFRGRPC
jgi:3-hydroxyacyl-CoA dehydrogenase/enoyl-CoA hydratase/3-hydroxybutyryl-CoA epimerase